VGKLLLLLSRDWIGIEGSSTHFFHASYWIVSSKKKEKKRKKKGVTSVQLPFLYEQEVGYL
jgi:hypothetical protein